MLSLSKSDFLDDESDNDDSESRYVDTGAFPLSFEESVGRVVYSVGCGSDIGFGVPVPTGIDSIGDNVLLVMFVPNGVNYKCG